MNESFTRCSALWRNLLTLLLCLTGTISWGQTQTIKGVIIDAQTREPIMGATIVEIDAKPTNGTSSDLDGNFTLTIKRQGRVRISFVGYQDQELAGSSFTQGQIKQITMSENAAVLGEIVVTALGIKREKKLLGYAMQDLKSSEFNKTGNPSITGALQGKVAGLQMNIAGTGLSGSTKITLRGNSSLTDNNQPLWIVDGVPFNDNNDSGASLYGGVDRGGVVADINPEDIESISVLKGPNAAALYGSRAGNGVILITTKSGSASKGFGVDYSSNLTWTQVASTLDMQMTYGQGVGGAYNANVASSWGAKLDGSPYTTWNGQEMPYQRYGNKLMDYFRTGFAQIHNVSVGQTKDTHNYRLSLGYTDSDGLFNGETLNKTNIDFKAGTKINQYLSLDGKISLTRSLAENRPIFGKGGEIYQLLYMPHNIRLEDLKTFSDDTRRHINYVGPSPTDLNPYYINYSLSNADERWRSFGYFSTEIQLTPWLSAKGKYAYDYYHTSIQEINRTNGIDAQETESLMNREDNFYEHNLEAILIGHNDLNKRLKIGYTLGVNEMYQRTSALLGKSQHMLNNKYWSHSSAQGFNAAEDFFSRRKTRSTFASLQLAWNEYLSLDLTARNDWSSTLPMGNNSYFYPSASLSFVLTELLNKGGQRPEWLSFAKARASWAQVGKDTEPYRLVSTGRWSQTPSGPSFTPPSERYNEQLRPELSSSIEAGLDVKLWNNRLGIDFTYYNSLTSNQIMRIPQAPSTGYHWKLINAGEIQNRGFELMVYGSPIRTKDFEWSLNANLAHNDTRVLELDPTSKYMSFNFRRDQLLVDVGAFEGGRLGDIIGRSSYKRNAEGKIITRNGLPLLDTENPRVIGNIQPDYLASLGTSLSYKGLSVSALVDMRFGGHVVSMSEAVAAGKGMAKVTEDREQPFVFDGIDEATGTPNTTAITRESFYSLVGGENAVAEEFIYSASFARLKELSISYSLPKLWLKGTPLQNVRLSLVGRNLCYLLRHTPGTSPEGGFDTSMFSQAIDFTSIPYTRTIGVSLNVQF